MDVDPDVLYGRSGRHGADGSFAVVPRISGDDSQPRKMAIGAASSAATL
jgi:hypothetical protein